MSLKSNTTNEKNEQCHHVSDGQLICDNEECRGKVLKKIQEINNEIKDDFEKIIDNNSRDNQINNHQGWNIICLISRKLSDRLIILFNKNEISKIIEQNNTKQAFRKAFDTEKNQEQCITKDQLWNIYMKMCDDTVIILSKGKNERGKHIGNFPVLQEN